MKRIVVLGGYGRAGYCIAETLLQAMEDTTVVVAGRRREAVQAAVRRLRDRSGFGDRVEGIQVDATAPAQLRRAFASCDAVVVAMPYHPDMAQSVIEAALEVGMDYLDVNADTEKHAILRAHADQIQAQGSVFLTDGGIVPGCPAMLLRWAQARFDRLDEARMASIYRDPDMPRGSAIDIVAHASRTPHVYRGGAWQPVSPLGVQRIDFGPMGRQMAAPVEWPELTSLPDDVMPTRLAAYQGSINSVVNALLLLWGLTGLTDLEWGRQLGVELFQRANRLFTTPPYGIVLQLDVMGQQDGKPVAGTLRFRHRDVYRATAIPVVAALRQMLPGDLPAGPAFMGQAVRPAAFRRCIEQLGMTVHVQAS
jgi:saccharopine dehydrogenase (NAD+, L-lysine-forming)